jgi:hypothetical protein
LCLRGGLENEQKKTLEIIIGRKKKTTRKKIYTDSTMVGSCYKTGVGNL